jgi:D-arabinose 1-dehydrogenase-like Zn-dependent alcohol dehydrogenase
LPRGVRLTAYGGGSGDLPSDVQRYLDRLAAGEVSLGPVRIYALEQIRQAHTDMEQNRTFGKMVVTTSP